MSESDVYRLQILMYKDDPRVERIIRPEGIKNVAT